MSTVDKNVHSEEKIINEPTAAPTTANPVTECEMDALLLGRIGVNIFFYHKFNSSNEIHEELKMSKSYLL